MSDFYAGYILGVIAGALHRVDPDAVPMEGGVQVSAEYPTRYNMSDGEELIDASDFDAREALWRELDAATRQLVEDPGYVSVRMTELRRLLGIEALGE